MLRLIIGINLFTACAFIYIILVISRLSKGERTS